MTQIGDTRIGGTRLVTLIATKFAGGTDICYAAANQISRTFDQSELLIIKKPIQSKTQIQLNKEISNQTFQTGKKTNFEPKQTFEEISI